MRKKKRSLGGPKKEPKGITKKAYRVDPFNNINDRETLMFAGGGMSNKCIFKITSHSTGQIYYRTKNFGGINRKQIRDGEHELSKVWMDFIRSAAYERAFSQYLRNHI